MHPYIAESQSRATLHIVLAALAVASTWLFQQSLALLHITIPWWAETPSALAFFGLYWKGFDLYAWRWSISRWSGWAEAPDLRGTWRATAETQYNNEPRLAAGRAQITQTSSHLGVLIRWKESRSYSVAGVIQQGRGGEPELIYQYVNEPDPSALATMEIHRGTAWLELISANQLVGEYFSGRGRQQSGKLLMERVFG